MTFSYYTVGLHTVPSKLKIIADYEYQAINNNSTRLLCTLNTIAILFWHPFSCIWLIRPSCETKHASDHQRLGSLGDTVL